MSQDQWWINPYDGFSLAIFPNLIQCVLSLRTVCISGPMIPNNSNNYVFKYYNIHSIYIIELHFINLQDFHLLVAILLGANSSKKLIDQQFSMLTITRSITITFAFSWITQYLVLQYLQTQTCLKVRNLVVMSLNFRTIPMCASGDIHVQRSLRTSESRDVAQ